MKKILFFLIFLALSVAMPKKGLAAELPLKDCLWFLPTMSLEQAKGLVPYDQIIVDPECAITSAASLDYLRANHPGIKILCYINPPEWFDPMWPDKPWSIKMLAELKKYPAWWLKGTDGKRISFWNGMYTMNCTWDCPEYEINGQKMKYIEFIADRFISDILEVYPFDGILGDNYWKESYWLGNYGQNHQGIDRDGNGKRDDAAQLNSAWRAGLSYFLGRMREFGGDDFIIIANPGHNYYAKYCDGKEYEDFPEIYLNEQDKKYQAWYENLNFAEVWDGPCIFVARKDNYFFTLCSAVLLDHVHFSDGQNRLYDQKYELHLGKPRKAAVSFDTGVKREFENGTVYVSPPQKAWVVYRDGRERRE